MMQKGLFHPAVEAWFQSCFSGPTPVQCQAWPVIRSGGHALLAAPTGSGKTLAAFLAVIDRLVHDGEVFGLQDRTTVLYISPLKALSNDIHKNLEIPLAGIQAQLGAPGPLQIRAAVRTGDTPAGERARMRRQPPHILVTTPESLYILLTSESGRGMLSTVQTVIVDELHAMVGNKRGAHLALSLERLAALCGRRLTRIGISATQKPMSVMARFLIGDRNEPCEIIDTGFARERDLALELPRSALQPVMAGEVWTEIHDRLCELAEQHRTTLVFMNTRRLAERVAHHLAERLGEQAVTAHHGSLAREHRLEAERRLKAGHLKVLVATASLELGIDIGDIDLVCQLGSPRGIATLLQRVGRSGHGVDALPKGRLFPLSRDELVECVALLDAVRRNELDAVRPQGAALDVLAQQIVAEVASGEWDLDALFALVRRAFPYASLTRCDFDAVVDMLAEGFATRRGRRSAWLHLDRVNGRVRARRAARLVALTNGGAIPDQFDYDVVLMPDEMPVGSLNEDFAFESLPGDIFQLGNQSYRILRTETGKVFVEDAHGMPPGIPFWFGEAPGRSDELSQAVSRLRQGFSRQMESGGQEVACHWLQRDLGLPADAAAQLTEYLATAHLALGGLPTQQRIVFERFFDELGDMHLVIHSPFGSRLNRAWGLALRKRFCRKFNFELQAAALEDSIVLSLGPTHSFVLADVARFLNADTVRDVLIQALLTVPLFATRWRWAASIALAVRRNRNGRKVPPQFQRSDAEDLLAVVFPDQLACAENLTGDREVPDHPLVRQTIDDCLNELMDIGGLQSLLRRISSGEVQVRAVELSSPSPLAQEIITARPYAFLDDAPAEERRTQAIHSRHLMSLDEAANLASLDPAAIDAVCAEAWPVVRDPDELHDALVLSGFLTGSDADTAIWRRWLDVLMDECRATVMQLPGGESIWVAAERLAQLQSVVPGMPQPAIAAVPSTADPDAALCDLLRSRLETLGPVTAAQLAAPLGLPETQIDAALLALEAEGFVVQGHFRGGAQDPIEWCERRLLARIHRRTLKDLRRQIAPVPPVAFMRFLFDWHGITGVRPDGPAAVENALRRLQGFAAPATEWETALLPRRAEGYLPSDLDQLLSGGRFVWLRPAPDPGGLPRQAPVANTAVTLVERADLDLWLGLFGSSEATVQNLSRAARRVRDRLASDGASFFIDLVRSTGMLRTQVEAALGELVAGGFVTADSYAGLRALIAPASKRAGFSRRRRGTVSVDHAGRWSLLRCAAGNDDTPWPDASVERVARVLLDRYGVLFRAVLGRESRQLPPWRELARVLRRMEARGEVRGGRFVSGFGGEQFAWPDAVGALRAAGETGSSNESDPVIALSAADPLNLVGIVTPGKRVPSTRRNRVLYRGGDVLAVYCAGEFQWFGEPDAAAEWTAHKLLVRNDPHVTYIAGSGSA